MLNSAQFHKFSSPLADMDFLNLVIKVHIFSCRRSRADLVVSITVLLLHVLEPLPLLSELRPFRTVGLSVNFSLLGTTYTL